MEVKSALQNGANDNFLEIMLVSVHLSQIASSLELAYSVSE